MIMHSQHIDNSALNKDKMSNMLYEVYQLTAVNE